MRDRDKLARIPKGSRRSYGERVDNECVDRNCCGNDTLRGVPIHGGETMDNTKTLDGVGTNGRGMYVRVFPLK